MDSTGSVDVQLLYNTSYTRQVSLGVEDGEAGKGPREGAGEHLSQSLYCVSWRQGKTRQDKQFRTV